MASSLLSNGNSFQCYQLRTSGSPCPPKADHTKYVTLCKAASDPHLVCCLALTRRTLSYSILSGYALSSIAYTNHFARAAILEADDDDELMEKVKKDRKKRLERQSILNASTKETGYLQELVYKLSKVGQAIENSDLAAANLVLGGSSDSEWVKNANSAFTKLSLTDEEKTQVDTFNDSLSSLISSVTKNDMESSKVAFVSSATALQKWTSLTGLYSELKGL